MRTMIAGKRSDSIRNISDVVSTQAKDFDNYFLANRTMVSSKTSSLLVSASFGANSILYAAWLGYLMGFWALFIHAAWCLSFVLLARFAPQVYQHTSLHDFLGYRFGRVTRVISASCSIVGLLYFAGWEIAIAKSGIDSLLIGVGINVGAIMPFVLAVTILIALLYTAVGGIKANGHVDHILNIAKFTLLGIVVFALGRGILVSANLGNANLLPNISSAISSIGVIGFVTNMLFNVSWQFIDNSSWQSISSGSKEEDNVAKKSLIRAGKSVFIAYILGTALGVFLRVLPNLNSSNVLGGVALTGMVSLGIVIGLVVLLLLSMISLIDGIGLSVAQSFLVDLKLAEKFKKLNGHTIARVLTVVVGIFAAWGIQLILGAFGKNTFDFVYIFIVAQLSLLGPVLVGLMFKSTSSKNIWVSILVGIIIGIAASIIGGLFDIAALTEAAGTISAITSVLAALLITLSEVKRKDANESPS